MKEKTVEELVQEIAKLQKDLIDANEAKRSLESQLSEATSQSNAIEAIKAIASNSGIDFDESKASENYWQNILTAIFLEVNQQAEDDLEELTTEAELHLMKQKNIIAMRDEEISGLQDKINSLQGEINKKDNDVNHLKKKEIELEKTKQTLVEVRQSREKINKNYRELSKEKAKAEKLIAQLQEEIKILNENNKLFISEIANIYSEVEVMIADVFRAHGYKVSPHSLSDENSKANDRQFELYKAVKAAKKADKKAEKISTGADVIYPADGYKNIEAELVKNYETIIEKYRKVNPELVEDFISRYATDEAKQDGAVTDIEMVRTILDKEQSKGGFIGFIKTTSGKILTFTTAILLMGTIYIASMFGIGKNAAEQQLNDTKTDLDITQSALDDANQQVADKEQQIQDIINGYLQGDMINVPVSAEEFNAYKSVLRSPLGGVVRGIESCLYNKETGKVEILVNGVATNRKEVTELITFTIDMSTVSSNITEGTSMFDFATIMDCMKSSKDYTRTSYSEENCNDLGGSNQMGSVEGKEFVKVYTSTLSTKNGNMTTVKSQVMLVKTDADGKVLDVETFSKLKTLLGEIDLNSEKEKVLDELLTELGIELSEPELDIE